MDNLLLFVHPVQKSRPFVQLPGAWPSVAEASTRAIEQKFRSQTPNIKARGVHWGLKLTHPKRA